MITSDVIQWRMKKSLGMSGSHHALFRDDKLMLQMEILTPKNKYGEFGKAKRYFFIDGDEREFLSEDELIEAYNDKFKFEGENPEYEVKYFKVITKRKQN